MLTFKTLKNDSIFLNELPVKLIAADKRRFKSGVLPWVFWLFQTFSNWHWEHWMWNETRLPCPCSFKLVLWLHLGQIWRSSINFDFDTNILVSVEFHPRSLLIRKEKVINIRRIFTWKSICALQDKFIKPDQKLTNLNEQKCQRQYTLNREGRVQQVKKYIVTVELMPS